MTDGSTRLRSLAVLAALVVCLVAAGCGGASTTTGAGSMTVTSITPSTIPGAIGAPFRIGGTGFAQVVGPTAEVTFTASGGATPFANGTAASTTLAVTFQADGTFAGTMAPACVLGGGSLSLAISLKLPSGVVSGPSAVTLTLEGPSVTAFVPVAPIVCGNPPFTVTGTGFGPVGGTAIVTFTAPTPTTPFLGGTSSTLVVANANIVSSTEISGLVPDPGVAGPVAATVTIQNPCGSVATGGGGVVASFATPTVTAFAPLGPIVCPSTPFTVTGTGLGSPGDTATVTFTAPPATTPFLGGTSNTLVVVGANVVNATTISALAPDPGVSGPVAATVTITLDCGPAATGGGGVVANFALPTVTAFAPLTPISGASTAVTVTGTGFEPVAGTAAITFTASTGTPFAGGTSATLIIPNATIDSSTQISGTCPDPATAVLVQASVGITLPCGKGATGGPGVQAQFQASGVDGTLQYQFVPHIAYNQTGAAAQASGLNFTATQTRPLAGVRVQLVRVSDQAVLASTASASDGSYSFDLVNNDTIVVRVLSQSHTGPSIQVVDNANADAVWAMQSTSFAIGVARVVQNLTATTGWGGASYTGARLAAPFAVFSTIYGATQKILSTVVPAPVFAALTVRWSPTNNQAAAFWDGTRIMLRGADGVNTDEFDTHVVIHEWGHYFESTFSRSDSPGGQHFLNLDYHPSLAWGEGWATGLAGMMLEPDSVYSDTSGPANAGGFMVDIERRLSPTASTFGWYNEWTVWELVYDLSDNNNEGAWDTLSLGVQGMFNSLANGQANTDAFVTVFSFIDTLKADNPGSAAAIDAMCALHGMTSPVQDEWGTGEANNGGSALNLPVYTTLTVNAAATPTTLNRGPANALQSTSLFRFVGNGAQVTLVGTSPAGDASNVPAFVPYRRGVIQGVGGIGVAAGNSASDSFNTVNGAVYTVWVFHWNFGSGGGTAGTYVPTIRVTSP